MKMLSVSKQAFQSLLDKATPFTKFNAPLKVVYDAEASRLLGGKYYRVTESFKYYIDKNDENRWVYIAAGYLSDGASVPKWLQWLIPPWGKYGQAAVVHDRLCETLAIYNAGQVEIITRARGDGIFREAMAALNVNELLRNTMYWAVRGYSRFFNVRKPVDSALKEKLETEWTPAV